MNEIFTFLKQFFGRFQLWIIVTPWQQAIRVRLGKHTKLLSSGVHFKIPFVDNFYIQTTRLRTVFLGKLTVTNATGQTITFSASVGYAISDILKLYTELHHADDYIIGLIGNILINYIATHSAVDCTPNLITEACQPLLDMSRYGLSEVSLFLGDFAVVKTYRLLGDQSRYTYTSLDTSRSTSDIATNAPTPN